MSWGIYWMFYTCPDCGANFKSGGDTLTDPRFGRCPTCGAEGKLIGESGHTVPPNANDYEDTADY